MATQQNLRIETIQTNTHPLLVFWPHSQGQNLSHLHVYFEGDGSPWFRGREPAIDPTATHPLALTLMLRDKHPSVYINRPCYAHIQRQPDCREELWTSGRYSQEVIDAMAAAIDIIKREHHVQSFSFFGHSGGANIALALAKQRDDVRKVVAVAGNIDHPRWTHYFGYIPLTTSLNARDVFPLQETIERWYLIGEKDRVVPATLIQEAAQDDKGGKILVFENYDHRCCWEKNWPALLEKVKASHLPLQD